MLGPEIPSSTSTDSIFKGHKYFSGKKKKTAEVSYIMLMYWDIFSHYKIQLHQHTHTRIYISHTSKVCRSFNRKGRVAFDWLMVRSYGNLQD